VADGGAKPRIEAADLVIGQPRQQGPAGAGGEGRDPVADRCDDPQRMAAGMGGNADDVGTRRTLI
jgi:hypothetical protein